MIALRVDFCVAILYETLYWGLIDMECQKKYLVQKWKLETPKVLFHMKPSTLLLLGYHSSQNQIPDTSFMVANWSAGLLFLINQQIAQCNLQETNRHAKTRNPHNPGSRKFVNNCGNFIQKIYQNGCFQQNQSFFYA